MMKVMVRIMMMTILTVSEMVVLKMKREKMGRR